jgi:hypothetical protein
LGIHGAASTPSLQPVFGHQRSIFQGCDYLEPEFFTTRTGFLQGRRGLPLFIFSAAVFQAGCRDRDANGMEVNPMTWSRITLDGGWEKSKGLIFTSGNEFQEQR